MAITGTTISSAVAAGDLVINVTSATGFATSTTAPQWIKIDSEYMILSPAYNSAPYNGTGTAIPVYRRGDQGSAVVAHNALAACVTGLFSDHVALPAAAVSPVPMPQKADNIVTYSVSGAIALPTQERTSVIIDKAGVAAMTLALPTKDMDGYVLTIGSTTAQAHTVTLPSAHFLDGLTGGPHTVWTATTGFKGQGLMIQAQQGEWLVLVNQQGTFS